jgi:hypothetical protein
VCQKKFIVNEREIQTLFNIISNSQPLGMTFGEVTTAINHFNKSIVEHKEPNEQNDN